MRSLDDELGDPSLSEISTWGLLCYTLPLPLGMLTVAVQVVEWC